ncbi:MAG: sugar-binding protein [Isosphaeraceae bacterium]
MNSSRSRGVPSRSAPVLLAVYLLAISGPAAVAGAGGTTIKIDVDARDLPRKLLHTQVTIPCRPGPFWFRYPKWIPGTHAASGPVDTLGGLRITTADGKTIPWQRDQEDLYRMGCTVPEGTTQIRVQIDTICNAASVDASGHLSYGNSLVGIINWPTCLVYPEDVPARETQVQLSLHLPERWKHASALKSCCGNKGAITFSRVSLATLADSPLIAGEFLRTIPLATGSSPPAWLELASESPAALELGPDVVGLYSRMVREAAALFGACHYSEFHFLVTCSDDLGLLGLEHLSSSLNGVRERDLVDGFNRKGWIANLIPHEYVHSWCGKYRRPVGQCTANFHTPERTALLWVYEGLTEYLGELLMVRSGLASPREYQQALTSTIGRLMHRTGRKWRSLEDTAVASALLRAESPNWNELRRDQDYYHEGALLWLEADAIIRQKTKGARGLDDFCRKFLGKNPAQGDVVPYDLAEIVRLLHETAEYDWESFLNGRVRRPLDSLPLDVVGRIGYRVEFASRPQGQPPRGRVSSGLSAQHSLGLTFSFDGQITDVVPGMAGDRARLAPGMKVMGIGGRLFSAQRLHDALVESVTRHKVELLVLEGDRFRTVVLDYSGGPKYLQLVRDQSKPDLLADILKPIADKKTESKSTSLKAAPSRADPLPKGYVAYRTSEAIAIDGKLDEKAWQTAPWTDAFVDIEGNKKPLPRFQSRAKMLWDDKYFYIAAQLDEPHVWGTLNKHDSVIFHDNDFEIFIDPDGDNHEYYEIELNALNTEWDLFLKKPYRDGGPAVNEWEIPGLKTAVHVEGTLNNPNDKDRFWSVEFAFPWKALAEYAHRASPPRDGEEWRINFSRVEWRHNVVDGKYRKVPNTPEDNWVWSPQGVIDMHRPELWGIVQFSTAQPGTVAFRPDPTMPIRNRLMQVYHAQKTFHEKTKKWADQLDSLELPAAPPDLPPHTLTVRPTPEGYEAELKLKSGEETWSVRQDSRICRKR